MKIDCAPCCMTYSGLKYYPLNPTIDMITLDDIAHALSLSCRFAGHIKFHYSIAEHSINCMKYVKHVFKIKDHEFLKQFNIMKHPIIKNKLMLHALMHDASEAYLTDIPKPLKIHLPDYMRIEKKWEDVIAAKLELPLLNEIERKFLKCVDNLMFMYECKSLWNVMPEDGVLYKFPCVDGHWQAWYDLKGPIKQSHGTEYVANDFYMEAYKLMSFYI